MHLTYKSGVSVTKTAFRLQIFDCQFTKLHFGLQSCISLCNSAYLQQLRGHKHLVIGNHDKATLSNEKAMAYFESVDKMMHVSDNGHQICLCHFPIAEWNGYYKGHWHIYGHIHNKKDETYEFMRTKERALNAAACINQYTPVSLNELKRNNAAFQQEEDTDCSG